MLESLSVPDDFVENKQTALLCGWGHEMTNALYSHRGGALVRGTHQSSRSTSAWSVVRSTSISFHQAETGVEKNKTKNFLMDDC